MGADQKVNILLVDDQPSKLMSYEVILRDLGENLIKAASGRQALEMLLKHEIAVVLIDVVMPELDGFELATMIREHPRFHSIAIIFVSAVSVTEIDRLRGYAHGAVDYISVPIVADMLRAKVRVFAELYRKTRELEHVNAELERRVAERTAALAEANLRLEERVEERTREREAALAQVHEMQKMESLGQLTGSVAHDFNNLLMGIIGALNYIAKAIPDDPKVRQFLTSAKESAERGASLTRRLLAFARRQELRPEPVEVRGLIENMAEMLRRSLGPTIEIALNLADHLALIRADPNQVELALLNLSLNARDAMPNGGRLVISAGNETIGDGHYALGCGEYVRLVVTDSGIGMDETTLKRCIEPFFTTKEPGKGTGLGLSSVHGLAVQSGGGIQVSSRPGEGTTVDLWFPVCGPEAERRTIQQAVLAEGPERRMHVLVVDDEPLIGLSTAAMLEDLGHTVKLAPSAVSALDMLRAGETIDLVITDHAMPTMTGAVLAGHIRTLRPELPVILATGYADIGAQGIQDLPILAKPYSPEELAGALSNLNAGRRAS